MFTSLRSRLILSFILVILLTLCVAGAGLLVFIQPFESARLSQRLVAALGPASLQARNLLLDGSPPLDIVTQVQDQLDDPDWRVLWVNDQRLVIADSRGDLVGRTLPLNAVVVNVTPRRFLTGRVTVNGRDYDYSGVTLVGRPTTVHGTLLILAVPRPFLGALQDLAGPLAGAGAIALVIAVLIGWFLAGSIASPIHRLTRATEEIARGNYEERIPTEGRDEVGRLGASFNAMARAVKLSQQAQKDFVANMSHELKTPLTSVQGFAQAIYEGAFHEMEGARNAAKLIYDESQRMSHIVADLLTLARLDAGDVPLEQQTLDLTSMLPTWVDRFRRQTQEAGLSLALTVDSPPPVQGDAGRLEQAVANLLDNAIKYNRPGGSITVKAESVRRAEPNGRDGSRRAAETPKEWAVIRVSDSGTGIPAVHLPRLFERFYRADKARVAGGSGLGLSIVQEIVEAHHGHIEVQSEEGQGTTFSVFLPGLEAGAVTTERARTRSLQ